MERRRRFGAWCALALALPLMAALGSCASGDARDQALDRLEAAIGQLEQSVQAARAAHKAPLSRELGRELDERGKAVQAAYGELRAASDEQLGPEQAKRRSVLAERAVAAVADMLDIRLADTAP